ncbi:hypothetical protein RI367_005062 [Sorochytrium milnesiophthora]
MHHIASQSVACAVIGVFTGWNPGVQFGWSSLLIAYLLATVMFWMLGLSITEMSCSLPFAGGPATFAQAAFGQEMSAFSGFTFTVAYCSGTAWAATFLVTYIATLCSLPAQANNLVPVLWLVVLVLGVLINYNPRVYFRITFCIAVTCCVFLSVYVISGLAHLDKIQTALYASAKPITISSVIQALPYGIFCYWGAETIPLTAEECTDITQSAPRATILSLSTLTLFSGFNMWLNCGLMPSLDSLISSNQALLDSFFYQIGVPLTSPVAVYVSTVILMIPCTGWLQGNLYAATRHAYSLARAGFLPAQLSYTRNGSPLNALLACAGVAYAFAIVVFTVLANPGIDVSDLLLSVTTWLLCASYATEMIVFIRLRYHVVELPRPWMNPVGIPGAAAGVLIASFGVFGPLATDTFTTAYTFGGYGIFMALIMAYYHAVAKQRLRSSPEKEFINAQLKRLHENKVMAASQALRSIKLQVKTFRQRNVRMGFGGQGFPVQFSS